MVIFGIIRMAEMVGIKGHSSSFELLQFQRAVDGLGFSIRAS